MSQVRKEELEISPEDFDILVDSCRDAGLEARIISSKESCFGRRYSPGAINDDQVIEIKNHGIEVYGKNVVEIVKTKSGVEFVVDLHANRKVNNEKFKQLKTNVESHYRKNKAIAASKKMGFTIASKQEDEDRIVLKVRKFI